MAILAALSVALVLVVLALGVTRETQLSARLTSSAVETAQADAAARAAELWVALALAARQADGTLPRRLSPSVTIGQDRLPVDGSSASGTAMGWPFRVTIAAERGKIDLRAAAVAEIGALLRASGTPRAAEITQAIATARGQRGRISWQVGDKAIESVEQIGAASGLTRAEVETLAEVATVHGRRKTPNPVTAPARLYPHLALDEDQRRVTDASRAAGRTPPPDEAEIYTLHVEVGPEDAPRARRTRLVEIAPNGALRWLGTIP